MAKGFDLGGLLQQAQEKLASFQQDLAGRTVDASAGGGMVTVTVNGRLEVVRVRIDPTLLRTPDVEMLQDLVAAAVNEGVRAAQKMMADEMSRLTGGLGLKLPGFP